MFHRPSQNTRRQPSSGRFNYRPEEWTGQPAGVILKAYREAYGKSIDQVATDLCIRRAHLQAIEKGEIQALPLGSYGLGFVRSYATYLGLPTDDLLLKFRSLSKAKAHIRNGPMFKPLNGVGTVAYSPRWPSFAVLVIAAILLGSSYFVMAAYSSKTSPKLLTEQELTVGVTILNDEPFLELEQNIDVVYNFENLPDAPKPTNQSNEVTNLTADSDQVVVYGIAIPMMRPDQRGLTPLPLEAVDKEHRVIILATGLAYITLADDRDGQAFLRAEYQRGEQYKVPDGKTVRLMTENLSELELILDGATYRVAPAIAALNEPLVLDPDSLPNSNQIYLVDDAL